jgi:glycosyltransferase involved in cell wall biosynthesis
MDRISVIVATYNRQEMLKRLLESFGNLKCSCPLEFIIVDDCSDDCTESVVEDWKKTIRSIDVKYKSLPARSGPARARNAGILISTGNILAFTDSDCRVDPQWIENLYQWLVQHPGYVGTGGRVLPLGDDIYSRYNTLYRILEPQHHLRSLIGTNFIIGKQPVLDAGMFDDYFFNPGGEETALCMKLWVKGYRFGFEPKAVVFHEYRKTLNAFIRTFLNYGTGEKIMIENRLTEYLQYIDYPEKMSDSVAFRQKFRFQVLFLFQTILHTFKQVPFLLQISLTHKQRLQLLGLCAIHHFCYHLGRGTFSGIVVNSVNRYLHQNPGCLLVLDPVGKTDEPLLKITDETLPGLLTPGQRVKASVSIKNISDHQWISASFCISVRHAGSDLPFFRSEEHQDSLFFPNAESVYHFSMVAPQEEKEYIVHLFISSPRGIPVSNTIEKKILVTSNPHYFDADILKTTFPEVMLPGEQSPVSILVKNTGHADWNENEKVHLGVEKEASGTGTVFGDLRIPLPQDADALPGSEVLFAFHITAPPNPGRYSVQYRMVLGKNSWFGKTTEQWIDVRQR